MSQSSDGSRPSGGGALTPYLIVQQAAQAIEFYQRAFGAREDFRLMMNDGRVGHAELRIGQARFSLADEFPELGFRSPQALGGTPVNLHLYVDDVDAFVARARAAQARVLAEPTDESFGDRVARLADPSGHVWMIATRKQEVSPEEMQRQIRQG
jgi:PhnB protein